MQTYLVGGAVRDKLLGYPVKDRDYLVVGATIEEMVALGYQQVGKAFPVFLHPENKQEYALARTEKKAGSGYTGFVCDFSPEITIEQDLIRRDLTVNAMAMADDGTIIDPFGGQQDVSDKVLRHVSSAFTEDPLRVLRVARFAARYKHLGFTIADETMTLMTELSHSGELEALTPERVWQETERALLENTPTTYFEVLHECGALKVILPELDCLWGVPNPPKWHPEVDTGIHTMMVLNQATTLSQDLTVRFAALTHDLGKGLTPKDILPHHHGHEKNGLTPIKNIATRMRIPNECRDLALIMSEYHTHVHKAFELKPTTVLKVFDKTDAWRKPERFEQFLLACTADMRGRTSFENAEYPQADYFRRCLAQSSQVDVKQIVAAGFKGAAIREQLNLQRQETIAEIKAQLSMQ